MFGPSYWAKPGESIPYFAVSGNHGLNSTFLTDWPESATASASGGVYAMLPYPSIDGTNAASYPTSYYAFSTGGVRFYMLDAAWGDSNVGTATGGACGSNCKAYQVDHDAHWTVNSAEYQWLKQDLAANPGGLKMAFFHYPLYTNNGSQVSDPYLDNTAGSSGSLEQLLHGNGVDLVFNGHAHIYERNVATPGGVTSYVTGGGGAQAEPVSSCTSTDAYAVGWSYSSSKGSACGSAGPPGTDSQVYHFLKVTVNGTSVTVDPINSQGAMFDPLTYNFASDTTPPSAPGGLKATSSSTKNVLTWTPATDNIGVSAYDVYRNGTYLATAAPAALMYTDKTATAGTGYTYQVAARDLAGNATRASVNVNGGSDRHHAPGRPGQPHRHRHRPDHGLALLDRVDRQRRRHWLHDLARRDGHRHRVRQHHHLQRHRADAGHRVHLPGHRLRCGGQRVTAEQPGDCDHPGGYHATLPRPVRRPPPV